MPATNTITASQFVDFAPATKARSSEVDGNFSIYRGHILPVDPNTSSCAANSTYDLGSQDHYWRTLYSSTIDLIGSTSTTNFRIVPRTSSTAGAVDFLIGSSTIASYGAVQGAISTYNPTYTSQLTMTLGAASTTITGNLIAGTTLTIATNGNPVLVCFVGSANELTVGIRTSISGIAIGHTGSAVALSEIFANLRFVRDTSTTYSHYMGVHATALTSTAHWINVFPPGSFWWVDFPGAGTHHYSLEAFRGPTGVNVELRALRLMAVEINI